MTTLTIDSKPLVSAVKRVLPHAAKPNAYAPALEDIRMFTRGDYLVLSATDRYTIIESRIPLSEVDAATPVEFRVSAAKLKSIMTLVNASALVLVTPRDDGMGATIAGAYIPSAGQDSSYPNVEKLWPERVSSVDTACIGLRTDALKKLAALKQGKDDKYTEPVILAPDVRKEHGPLVVMFGADTRVLVMPMTADAGANIDNYADLARGDYTR